MLKQKPFLFAVVYSVIVVAFKLFVFYAGLQITSLGYFSHVFSLLLLTPFVFLLIFLVRKDRGGNIGGKTALKEGLAFVLVAVIIFAIFNYIFYEKELHNYIINFKQTKGPGIILQQAAKEGKKFTSSEISKMINDEVENLSAFKDTTSKLFSMLFYGVFSSVIAAILLKRNGNG